MFDNGVHEVLIALLSLDTLIHFSFKGSVVKRKTESLRADFYNLGQYLNDHTKELK